MVASVASPIACGVEGPRHTVEPLLAWWYSRALGGCRLGRAPAAASKGRSSLQRAEERRSCGDGFMVGLQQRVPPAPLSFPANSRGIAGIVVCRQTSLSS